MYYIGQMKNKHQTTSEKVTDPSSTIDDLREIMTDEAKTQIAFTVTKSEAEDIDSQCKEKNVSRTQLIRDLVIRKKQPTITVYLHESLAPKNVEKVQESVRQLVESDINFLNISIDFKSHTRTWVSGDDKILTFVVLQQVRKVLALTTQV